MNFSEEWRSIFPIDGVELPRLLQDQSLLGPLCFNPKPQTLTILLSSPSLSPPLLNPPSSLSLSRFLAIGDYQHSSLPLSTASSVASLFGPQSQNNAASVLAHNRLGFLNLPSGQGFIVFFSTGLNSDRVGFVLVRVKNGRLVTVGGDKDGIFSVENRMGQRIVRILVNPVGDFGFYDGESFSESNIVIGYLLVYSMYSVNWYSVKLVKDRPVLNCIGYRDFRSCVVSALWSPHIGEESAVLLENGVLYVFDLESHCLGKQFRGTRLDVLWCETDKTGKKQHKWLGCEFSWDPRILIVVCSNAAFLVDWRNDEIKMSCVEKIDMFGVSGSSKEHFLAISKVLSDHFHFILVTDSLLVICDVRSPMRPVLQWKHGLEKPSYVDVFRLSDLRSNSEENAYECANASGFGIILGSFWNCNFRVFCYGPSSPAHNVSGVEEASKFSRTISAWELPSNLPLSSDECCCGSCLTRQEFAKDSLPEWVDWQQKKDMILGFGILCNDLSSLLYEPDEFGGFTLIRLMSSGKLEYQAYCASWDLVRSTEAAHNSYISLHSEDNLVYCKDVTEYKLPKIFKYLKLNYLYAYLNGNLAQVLDENTSKRSREPSHSESFSLESHEMLCKNLKLCGFCRVRVSPAIRVVFDDINLPLSIREVAFKRIWASLPTEFLQLAFSTYTEFQDILLNQKKVPLEFLVVPSLPQLPPYILRKPSNRSSRWTQRVQRSDSLVGPLLPIPVLITLHEFLNGYPNSQELGVFSSDAEISARCDEVIQVARELAFVDSMCDLRELDEDAMSLADDNDDIQLDSEKPKSFYLYRPVASQDSNEYRKDEKSACLISKLHKVDKANSGSQDIFDDLCPIHLKFDTNEVNFSSKELKAYSALKRDFANWQKEFSPYRAFCSTLSVKKDARL